MLSNDLSTIPENPMAIKAQDTKHGKMQVTHPYKMFENYTPRLSWSFTLHRRMLFPTQYCCSFSFTCVKNVLVGVWHPFARYGSGTSHPDVAGLVLSMESSSCWAWFFDFGTISKPLVDMLDTWSKPYTLYNLSTGLLHLATGSSVPPRNSLTWVCRITTMHW